MKDTQTRQISLVLADSIPVTKDMLFSRARHDYRCRYGEVSANRKIAVFVESKNRKESNLAIPLPKGSVRVYQHDAEGSLQFIGLDAIDHTAKDEKGRIKLGDAFDVVGGRKQTDRRTVAHDTDEAAFEVTLRNHKHEDVLVRIVEPSPATGGCSGRPIRSHKARHVPLSSRSPYKRTARRSRPIAFGCGSRFRGRTEDIQAGITDQRENGLTPRDRSWMRCRDGKIAMDLDMHSGRPTPASDEPSEYHESHLRFLCPKASPAHA